jgi:hypothetical protein
MVIFVSEGSDPRRQRYGVGVVAEKASFLRFRMKIMSPRDPHSTPGHPAGHPTV